MIRLAVLKVRGLALALGTALLVAPGAVGGFSIDQQGCVEPAKLSSLPPLPQLTGMPVVKPEDSSGPWTATFKFNGSGTLSITWGCLKAGYGTAEGVKYATTVEGRYGHGYAEEVVTLSVGKPIGSSETQPWMGTHTFTTYLQCPDGDPWLFGKPCTVTGTATPIPGIHFKGPFPLTRGQVPATQREQLLYKAFPPKIVKPLEKQQIPNGQAVQVELAKSGPFAAQPVTVVFSSGAWANAKTFKRIMTESSLSVEGSAFGPGEWTVKARYSKEISDDGASRAFTVLGGWGGGPAGSISVTKPRPGAEGPVMPTQPIPPVKTRRDASPGR